MKRWVETWKRAGSELERILLEEVKRADTSEAILVLSRCMEPPLRDLEPRPTSGLVEQQFWFRKPRRRKR